MWKKLGSLIKISDTPIKKKKKTVDLTIHPLYLMKYSNAFDEIGRPMLTVTKSGKDMEV